ncbi:MAG: T9SS type A sorting domain-containing protein [Ignavibacteria bacterium]|nr:T9SS type A sorting domain-containing protein [Ignavibacteria bacterium]
MRKLILSFLVIALLFVSNISYSQWYQQNSGVTANLYSIHFINDNTGIACGYSNTIIKTSNGGENWTVCSISPPGELRHIKLLTAYIALTGGANGNLYRTTNFGTNWTVASYGGGAVNGICIAGSNIWYTSSNKVFTSTDFGYSWIYYTLYNNRGALGMSFGDSLTGYTYGAYLGTFPYQDYIFNWIQKTSNGGQSWIQIVNLMTQGQPLFSRIFFINSQTGFVGQWQEIRKTTNGGGAWTIYQTGTFPFLSSIFFIDEYKGFISENIDTRYTTNGGENWSVLMNVKANEICFTNSMTGWLCGDSGLIMKTTNGGITGMEAITPNIPNKFSLFQNYPNPFNPTTTIRYDIKSKGYVELKVFDLLGREITTLVNESQTPGTYEVVFYASSLPSGVYFYRLKAGDFVETRKMVVLK